MYIHAHTPETHTHRHPTHPEHSYILGKEPFLLLYPLPHTRDPNIRIDHLTIFAISKKFPPGMCQLWQLVLPC